MVTPRKDPMENFFSILLSMNCLHDLLEFEVNCWNAVGFLNLTKYSSAYARLTSKEMSMHCGFMTRVFLLFSLADVGGCLALEYTSICCVK